MSKRVVIIGGGLGGLFAGAILAKEGYDVTILEKNRNIGGGLQTFVRDGEVFETGMHILGGLRQGGSIHKICNYLGILDKLNIKNVDADCADTLHYLSDNATYRFAEGRENFAADIARRFPGEAENIRRYVDAIYALTEEVDYYYLRHGAKVWFKSHSEEFMMPVDEFIARYVEDPKLRDILGYMNPMYGGVAGHTPAYVHALISVLYINGAGRFAGGSHQLAEALRDVVTAAGGQVLAGAEVTEVAVENREIRYVATADGSRFCADTYISAIHPCSLLRMMDPSAFPRSYRNRLGEIPNSYSTFTVYLTLNDGRMPYINHTCYCQEDYGMVWNCGEYDDSWPRAFMYITPPEAEQGEFSRKMIIMAPMNFDAVRRWENTTVGKRGGEYEEWKRGCAERIISKMERIYPGLRADIRNVYTSSPLTIRDYYNVKEGAIYGYRKDCRNIELSQLPIYTKVKNLLLTGQNVNLHGICGTPLTAVMTAETLVGENVLVDKINHKYKISGYEND